MKSFCKKPEKVKEMKDSIIYCKANMFASWPFNTGMWRVADDNILVSFIAHECDYTIPENLDHTRIETYGKIVSMRTRDRGATWVEGGIIADNVRTSDEAVYGRQPTIEPADFSDSKTLLTCWTAPNSAVSYASCWIKISRDGGESWGETSSLPSFIFPRMQGRPSYILRPDGALLLMLTARSKNDPYDRPIVYASFDGGVHWTFINYIAGSNTYRMICPSPILLKNGRILAAIRCKPSSYSAWTEVYVSDDGGGCWSFLSRVNDSGAPGHLVLLKDDRIVCVYGYRRPPYGIRLRISSDQGKTWGQEWILRDDGANVDLGYPRGVELENNQMLVSYYFNSQKDENRGIRHIASTLFTVPE